MKRRVNSFPTEEEFLEFCKKIKSEKNEKIARFYYNHANEYISMNYVSEKTGYTVDQIRLARFSMTNMGMCWLYEGTTLNRKNKILCIRKGKGFAIREDEIKEDKIVYTTEQKRLETKKLASKRMRFDLKKDDKMSILNSVFN